MFEGYKLSEASDKDIEEMLAIGIGIISKTMLGLVYDKKYLKSVDGRKALDIIEICKSVARIAVSKEAKEEDDDLIHAVGVLMAVAMHFKAIADGAPLEFNRLDKI